MALDSGKLQHTAGLAASFELFFHGVHLQSTLIMQSFKFAAY